MVGAERSRGAELWACKPVLIDAVGMPGGGGAELADFDILG